MEMDLNDRRRSAASDCVLSVRSPASGAILGRRRRYSTELIGILRPLRLLAEDRPPARMLTAALTEPQAVSCNI